MQDRYEHVVHLRLTGREWRQIDELARLRSLTIEELIRETLHLPPPDSEPRAMRKRHLRVVQPG
jgi:hypothetical protein